MNPFATTENYKNFPSDETWLTCRQNRRYERVTTNLPL